MDQTLNNNKSIKDKIISFYINNKLKIIFFILIVIISIISLLLLDSFRKKENNLISEKYVQANLYLAANNTEKAKNIYEEIILSKNKFYSILSMNLILEKNLIKNKKKILEYFEILENIKYSKDTSDLIKFKKSLYLINDGELELGKNLLKELISDNSILEEAAREIIQK